MRDFLTAWMEVIVLLVVVVVVLVVVVVVFGNETIQGVGIFGGIFSCFIPCTVLLLSREHTNYSRKTAN